jgi:hypothetical protein
MAGFAGGAAVGAVVAGGLAWYLLGTGAGTGPRGLISSRDRCRTSDNNIVVCLVPSLDRPQDGKQVAPGCYWLTTNKESTASVRADGTNQRFNLEVVNQCSQPASVRFVFKGGGNIRFLTAECPTGPGAGQSREFVIPAGLNQPLACDTEPYRFARNRERRLDVDFIVTEYGGVRLTPPVNLDPQVRVEHGGDP